MSSIFSKTGLRNRIKELNFLITNQREQIEKQQEKIKRYEEVLKEIADSFAFDDVYDEVTAKRFIAKQVLENKCTEDKDNTPKRTELIRHLGNKACDRNDEALKKMEELK